jgi:mRNA interferase RelE/StbE
VIAPYHIKIGPAAQRQIQTLPGKQCKQVIKMLEALAINPRPPGAKRLEGMTGLYSETINQLKIIYKVEEQEVLVLVVKSS